MTACLEIARAAGRRAAFAPTGQTGMLTAGTGIAIDRVVSDFASGATERVVIEAQADADVVFVEGQGAITHPAFAPVTLALMFGAAPDSLILVHDASRSETDRYGTPLLSVPRLIRLHEELCETVKPAPVIGIVLNTGSLSDEVAQTTIRSVVHETGLPTADVVRDGAADFFAAIEPQLRGKTDRRRATSG